MGVILAAALCGAAVAALLPLPIFRLSVPYGSPPAPSCPHCGRSPGWVGPVCPQCTRQLGPPWWATGVAGGLACAVVAWALGSGVPAVPVAALVLYLLLALLAVLLAFVDVAVHRLPTAVVVPAAVISLVALAVLAAFEGGWGSWLRALLGGLVLGGIFLVLYAVPGGNLGFGDVQLAALLGLWLGWLGWAPVLWGALLPWLVNVPVVLVLLASRRVHRRSRIPFGPALLTGALLALALAHVLAVGSVTAAFAGVSGGASGGAGAS